MYFSAAASSENDYDSMNLASNTGSLRAPVSAANFDQSATNAGYSQDSGGSVHGWLFVGTAARCPIRQPR
jgi:hypothetical protein